MKPFELLPHTADVRLKVFGKTKEELFKNALAGMAKILKRTVKEKKPIKTKINIQSPDINSLLIDFLSEVLYQSQINKAVYSGTEFSKFSDNKLEAEISGFEIDEFDEDIKAVTYHELDVKKSPANDFFETIVIFDI